MELSLIPSIFDKPQLSSCLADFTNAPSPKLGFLASVWHERAAFAKIDGLSSPGLFKSHGLA